MHPDPDDKLSHLLLYLLLCPRASPTMPACFSEKAREASRTFSTSPIPSLPLATSSIDRPTRRHGHRSVLTLPTWSRKGNRIKRRATASQAAKPKESQYLSVGEIPVTKLQDIGTVVIVMAGKGSKGIGNNGIGTPIGSEGRDPRGANTASGSCLDRSTGLSPIW